MSPLTIRFERMKDVNKTLKWGFTRLDFLENTMNGALDFAVLPPLTRRAWTTSAGDDDAHK